MDRLYIEFDKDRFEGIDASQELEVDQFIKAIQDGTHKFDDYGPSDIEYFASRIYELRKNNSNNTAR
jgi:hypothetical protein